MLKNASIVVPALLATVLYASASDNKGPLVESPAGTFKGHILKTRHGREVYSFEGIPYAKPPVSELRFKDPVKMGKIEGVYEAVNSSIMCYQPPMNLTQMNNVSAYLGSEDCLYLNVHVPKDKGNELLPVFVWIHGGGFFIGSGSSQLNGPDYLLDKDMVLVTMNYRLGVLGFLSTGDKTIPGNLGLKDQVMALKWVQENIASFGGDAKAVTIGGQSAGAAAVSLLMHSPLAKGLFNRVIAQSSTLYSAYVVKPATVGRSMAEKVASYLGCSFKPELLLRCLQKMPKEEVMAASNEVNPKSFLGTMEFSAVIEEPSDSAFMTKESYKNPGNVPLMAGVTNRESFYLYFLANLTDSGFTSIRKELADRIPEWGYYSWKSNKDNITNQLTKYYFNKGTLNATAAEIIDFHSDFLANQGLYLAGKTEKSPTYLYVFSYIGLRPMEIKVPKDLEDAVSHGEDMKYLFKSIWLGPMPKEWSKEDMDMSQKMIDMWYNFIKFGKPTGDGSWTESEGGTKYLDITNKGLVMKTNMFQQRMQFLDNLNIDRTM